MLQERTWLQDLKCPSSRRGGMENMGNKDDVLRYGHRAVFICCPPLVFSGHLYLQVEGPNRKHI